MTFSQWIAAQPYPSQRAAFRTVAKALIDQAPKQRKTNGPTAPVTPDIVALLMADLEMIAFPVAPGGGSSSAAMMMDASDGGDEADREAA